MTPKVFVFVCLLVLKVIDGWPKTSQNILVSLSLTKKDLPSSQHPAAGSPGLEVWGVHMSAVVFH